MTTELSHIESVKYLRDSAIRAHLDGQGAKARELAVLALIKEANRGRLPIVNLEDLVWAFYLVIYWMLHEEDFSVVLDGAWETFIKKQAEEAKTKKLSEDDHWHSVIRFLMDVLRPNPLDWNQDIKALRDIPRTFFIKNKDQCMNEIFCMILPFVVDFVYHLFPDKKDDLSNTLIWHSLCKHWESLASYAKNEDLRKTIITTRERIEKQHTCLLEPGAFPYHAENALEEFWDAFYKIDIDKMKEILPRLTKLVHEDEGKFYPVQSLINISRFTIGWGSDQFPGVYRIQRLYMENPQWLFGHLRSTRFSEVLNKFYFEVQQKVNSNINSIQIWQLPLVAEIIALQNWDLRNYLNSIIMQSKAWLFLGLSSVKHKKESPSDLDADDLSTGIYHAVKGWALQDKTTRHFNDVEQAFLTLELNENSKSKIKSLLQSLIKSLRPIEMKSAVNLFSVMSDAIPKDCLADVFRISITAFLEKNNGFDWKILNWWSNVLKWVVLDKTDWDITGSFLTDLFRNPFSWNICGEMLQEALIKAPMNLAENWANIIAENRSKDDLNQYGRPIVYNASLERFELKKYTLRILDFLKDDTALSAQMEYDRALLLAADEGKSALSKTSAGQKCRLVLIEQLLQYAQSVAVRNAQPRHFTIGMPFQWRQFQRIIWTNLSHDEWAQINQTIKAAIQNQYCTQQDFISLILVWSIIASQQKRTVIDEAGKWLIDLCKNFKITALLSPNTNDPFSRMSIISGITDSIRFAKTVALSRFLHKISPSVCTNMLSWIQDEIPDAEDGNQPMLWEMLLALYIAGTHSQSIWALNALKAIYARIADSTELLAEAIEKSHDVFITSHGKKGRRLIETLRDKKDKDVNSILNMLDKVIGKLVHVPIPNGRRAAAMVLNLYMEMGWINEQRGKWIENLKKDPRARVYSVFKT